MIGLVCSLYAPEWPVGWTLLDKDHPATAFLFDLTGAMVMLGVVLVVIRRLKRGAAERLPGLPGPDWASYGLLGGIMVVGFVLEGMRMAMTGSTVGAAYAFLGYGISRLCAGSDLTGIYGYVWYAHAILTAAFVAYLPSSRMFHMIMAPVTLALNAGSRPHHLKRGVYTINK